MPYNLVGQYTPADINNSTIFLLPPGRSSFATPDGFIELTSGQDYLNPGLKGDGTPNPPKIFNESAPTPEPEENKRSITEGTQIAKGLYSFLPEAVVNEFAKAWVDSGDANVAMGLTRQTKPWKDNFGKLMRDDGTLMMTELDFLSTKAGYEEALAEVGIENFDDFQDEFDDMATGFGTDNPVSSDEFRARVDFVYAEVKDQIPEVSNLFRQRYNISLDEPTIFAALINPKIQDKVLMGDISTLQLQAEASSRGFSTSFARFQQLRNMGLTREQAKSTYATAATSISQARSIGRDLDITTIEDAAVGDTAAQQRLQRIGAELESSQGLTLGAAKKGDEVIGLTTD